MATSNKSITVDDLIEFYGVENDIELSKRLNFAKGTISKWRKNGINTDKQAVFQCLTNNQLEADLSDYSILVPQATEDA